jgi:hypothetical protein
MFNIKIGLNLRRPIIADIATASRTAAEALSSKRLHGT